VEPQTYLDVDELLLDSHGHGVNRHISCLEPRGGAVRQNRQAASAQCTKQDGSKRNEYIIALREMLKACTITTAAQLDLMETKKTHDNMAVATKQRESKGVLNPPP